MKLTHRYLVLLRAALLVTTGAWLAGCDTLNEWFASDRINYQNVQPGPALSVPADLSQQKPSQRFAMPAETESLGKPASPTSAVAQHRLHLEYDGNVYWLIALDEAPEQLWPRLEELWAKSGFTLTADQPELGIIETDWTENRAKMPHREFRKKIGAFLESLYSSGTRDKFRTLVQRQANGTAISMTHQGMEEVVIGRQESSRWQDRAREPKLELAFLTKLMESLGLQPAQIQNLIDQAQKAPRTTAKLEQQTSSVLIVLEEPFARAWWRVGLALGRMHEDLLTVDSDKARGLYVVGPRQMQMQQKPGWLKQLFKRDANQPLAARTYLIQVQSVTDSQTHTTQTQIAVITKDGQRDNTPAARKLILALHAQLN